MNLGVPDHPQRMHDQAPRSAGRAGHRRRAPPPSRHLSQNPEALWAQPAPEGPRPLAYDRQSTSGGLRAPHSVIIHHFYGAHGSVRDPDAVEGTNKEGGVGWLARALGRYGHSAVESGIPPGVEVDRGCLDEDGITGPRDVADERSLDLCDWAGCPD